MNCLRKLFVFATVAGLVSLFAFSAENRIGVRADQKALELASDFVMKQGPAVFAMDSHEKLLARSSNDDGEGVSHVRFDSYANGVRVFDGEVIVHVDRSGQILGTTGSHARIPLQDATPAIDDEEAGRVAFWNLQVLPSILHRPDAELIYYPTAEGYRLAWYVDIYMETPLREDPVAHVYVIDAYNSEVIADWDNLQYYTVGTGTAKVGTAKPLYLAASPNTLPINTEQYSDGVYGLVDRLAGNSYTTNMKNKTAGNGTLFTDADNVWGNYLSSDTSTAAVDAHLGMSLTFNYFKNVHGRNGIYNDGKGVYSRVHYGRRYNNAFWSDSCKCMTYGDGDGSVLSPLVCIDVAAHEMSHGLCAATAKLVYSGQSGALNESNSDIFGTCVEFYANSAKDTPDWLIGETIYTPAKAGDALRYMDHPAKDGYSIDHYSKYTSSMDVHYTSGLANNFFYLLANGGTNDTSKIAVAGIGLAKAERIWFVALTGYMTSTCTFAQARTATVSAATQLYGAGSVEVQRVQEAWTACGVN